jgi:hypothetical protein
LTSCLMLPRRHGAQICACRSMAANMAPALCGREHNRTPIGVGPNLAKLALIAE